MLSKFGSPFLRRRLGNTKPYRLAAEVRKGFLPPSTVWIGAW